jgi:hypothetical protein
MYLVTEPSYLWQTNKKKIIVNENTIYEKRSNALNHIIKEIKRQFNSGVIKFQISDGKGTVFITIEEVGVSDDIVTAEDEPAIEL